MNEAYLKARLVSAVRRRMKLLPEAVRRHEDKFTAGGADLSVSRNRMTAWVEVKYVRRGRTSEPTALQKVTLEVLDGLLVEYIEGPGDRKYTWVTDSRGRWLVATSGEEFRHDRVAEAIEQWLDGGWGWTPPSARGIIA